MNSITSTGETGVGNFTLNPEVTLKQRLQADISAARNEPTIRMMVRLLEILINDTRKENDRSLIRAVLRNQGKIAAFQELLDIITRDYPDMQNFS